MTAVYFTTVVRAAPPAAGGEVVCLDWATKQVASRLPVGPCRPQVDDANPRGNTRGGRGVWLGGEGVVVAGFDQILCLDPGLALRRALTNGLMVGLHEVCPDAPGRLWVAATSIDAALLVDLDTGRCARALWPREMAGLQRRLGVAPAGLDKGADLRYRFLGTAHTDSPHHLHLNAVAARPGQLLALLNRPGCIVDLEAGEVLVRHRLLVGSHNLCLAGDLALVAGTDTASLCVFDLASGNLVDRLDLAGLEWVAGLARRARQPRPWAGRRDRLARPLFVRGLSASGRHALVGLSPAAVVALDWQTGELLDAYQHSDDVRVCVHGLAATPEAFAWLRRKHLPPGEGP